MPISYVTVGTNDLDRALIFYDELAPALGGGRAFAAPPSGQFYQFGEGALLGVFVPVDGQPASWANGGMIAFEVEDDDRVRALYERALALGGSDAGPPATNPDTGFFAAYVRDPDGNKICVYRS